MKPSTVKEITGGEAVKIPFSGKGIVTICDAVRLAINNQPKLKNVILNIDTSLLTTKNENSSDYPSYLYDKNIFNDVNYLLNKDVIFEKCISVIKNRQKIESADTAFSSEKQFYFAEFVSKNKKRGLFDKNEDVFLSKLKNNLSVIENLIAENPNLNFYLFIPPRNIMYLKIFAENNQLDYDIKAYKTVYETLSAYDNVSISFFQNEADIVGNLYNYCDCIHFSSRVSDFILRSIFNESRKLTDENYVSELESIPKIYEEFDYSVFSPEAFPFKSETDTKKYTEMLKDYITVVNCSEKFVPSAETVSALKCLGVDLSDSQNINGAYFNGEKYSESEFEYRIKNDSVFIDGIDYSLQLENGINIIVYDSASMRVLDSAHIDNEKVVHERNVRK